jgi:hypothetical protein
MADFRLFRPRTNRVWLWTCCLAAIAFLFWSWGTFYRDPTAHRKARLAGEAANFGAERTPVIPVVATPFDSVKPIEAGDLGLLVRIRGTTLSPVRRSAVWVAATDGRRILVRFEPPPAEALRSMYPGAAIDLDGYLQKLALAEFKVWMDTLGVSIPRPPPGVKFGDVPDPGFARLDSLFIKEYYVSVRPEALTPAPAAAP